MGWGVGGGGGLRTLLRRLSLNLFPVNALTENKYLLFYINAIFSCEELSRAVHISLLTDFIVSLLLIFHTQCILYLEEFFANKRKGV